VSLILLWILDFPWCPHINTKLLRVPFPHVWATTASKCLLQLCYTFSISWLHASLLPPCPCSISDGSLCTAASSCYSRSWILSASCRKVVGVTVLSKVSPMATSREPSGVCGSESRKLRSRVAVWLKSKDETVSCESNWLHRGAARAPIPGLLGVCLWIRGVERVGAGRAVWLKSKDVTVSCESNWLPGGAAWAPIPRWPGVWLRIRGVARWGARLEIWLSTSVAPTAQSSVNPSRRSSRTLCSCCILALMVLRMFLRIIVCTQSGQEAQVWRWRPKRSSELNVMLASEPEREDTGFGVRLTCYGLRVEVACFKMHPCLPCSQSMPQYGTG